MEVSHAVHGNALQTGSYNTVTNGIPKSPYGHVSVDQQQSAEVSRGGSAPTNDTRSQPDQHVQIEPPPPVINGNTPNPNPHIVHLSAVEHCMPRAYIRVCLAYRMPPGTDLNHIIKNLNQYARKLVDAKPYLAGFVVPAAESNARMGLAEIQFTDEQFLNFPSVEVNHLTHEGTPLSYDELDRIALPPSVIRPGLVSALPEGADEGLAPAFQMQANVVEGGLIISVYLHHCIADGTGLHFLLTGAVLNDEFAFHRHLEAGGLSTPTLNERLAAFAKRKSIVRQKLSWSDHNQINDRKILHKNSGSTANTVRKTAAPGRGCLVAFSRAKLAVLEKALRAEAQDSFLSPNDALQALIWHHMTKARMPSVQNPSITHSKLLIPVNIRKKLKEPIADSYLGAAVDFAVAEMNISALCSSGADAPAILAHTALVIRRALESVDEAYIRQAIALSLIQDPNIDVRDLMASNMDRREGADMYITSWEKLGLYEATLGMGLGNPDWVRKPWSKDPGACVIMPSDDRKDYLEVLVQMTEVDMERLLADNIFMSYIVRTID